MKMQAADYAWVVFAAIILAVLVAGWRIKDGADPILSAQAATPDCKAFLLSCETIAQAGPVHRMAAQ